MATLPYPPLPSRQQIIDQQLTHPQIQAQERAAVRARQRSRLANPDARPRTLDLDSLNLLQEARKRIALIAFVAPPEIEQYLILASCNLTSAIYEAAQPYPDVDLLPIPSITQPLRLSQLSANHLKALRDKIIWLTLLVQTAPVDVALYLLSVTDWIQVALVACEYRARQDEARLIEAAEQVSPYRS